MSSNVERFQAEHGRPPTGEEIREWAKSTVPEADTSDLHLPPGPSRPFPEDSDEDSDDSDDADRRVVASPNDPIPNVKTFLAERYHHPERELLVCHGGAFHAWDGACWPEVEEAQLRADLYDFFADTVYEKKSKSGTERVDFQPNRHSVANLVDALKAVGHLPKTVSAPAWLGGVGDAPADEYVACTNGVVHVPTRTRHPLTPSLYVHHAVPFAFDPDAPTPERWLAFLKELWPDDQQSIDTLQEIFGYVLSGDTRQQKIFMLVGPKRGGKGTIGRVLRALIGEHHVASPTLAALSTNFGLSPLIGKPLAVISDARLQGGDTTVTERLLSISGEDSIDIDRKYREPWSGKLSTRFVILTNELPRLVDSSGALASRFVLLTLTRSFYGQENTTLTDELLTELPGIFNWALDGLVRLRDRGRFVQPAASDDAIRELEDLGSPITAFVRDRCVVGPESSVAADALYRAWRSWCHDHGRDQPGTAQTFGRDLRAVVPGVKVSQPTGSDGKRYRAYNGVRLRSPQDPDPDPANWDDSGHARVPPRASGGDDGRARGRTRSSPLRSQSEEGGESDPGTPASTQSNGDREPTAAQRMVDRMRRQGQLDDEEGTA